MKCRVGVIGGGITGLVCAYQLVNRNVIPVVVDMGRDVGGRMSTREVDRFQFDHGCQFIQMSTKSPKVAQLFDEWKKEGLLQQWTGRFLSYDELSGQYFSKNHIDTGFCDALSGEALYVACPSMQSLCKHLAKQPGIMIYSGSKVDSVKFDDKWQLTITRRTEDNSKVVEEHGPFDALIFTDKLNARENSSGCVIDSGGDLVQLYNDMLKTDSEAVYALLTSFKKGEMDYLNFDALSFYNSDYFQWICRDSSKPGRSEVSNFDNFVCITTSRYALELKEKHPWVPRGDPGREKFLEELTTTIFQQLCQSLKVDFPVPVYKSSHRWGSAFQLPQQTTGFQKQDGKKVVACGDFCCGSRIELIVQSAVDASNYVVDQYLKSC